MNKLIKRLRPIRFSKPYRSETRPLSFLKIFEIFKTGETSNLLQGQPAFWLTHMAMLLLSVTSFVTAAFATINPDKNITNKAVDTNIINHTSNKKSASYPTPRSPYRIPPTAYPDIPYQQDYSIRYYPEDSTALLRKIVCDRNGNIRILSDKGLLKPHAGKLLFPGTLTRDLSYKFITDRKITGLSLYDDQLIYLDDKALFSNAWAGTLDYPHQLRGAGIMAGGSNRSFLISNGVQCALLYNGQQIWTGTSPSPVISIQYQAGKNLFWCLTAGSLSYFSPLQKKLVTVFTGEAFTCFKLLGNTALIGTHNGYLELDLSTYKSKGGYHRRLPNTDLTVIEQVNGRLWFGSSGGAFMLKEDGKFNYYASQRWLPGNIVSDIAKGEEGAVLVLTDKGLGKICFEKFTLEQKAAYYEEQVRQRHIRYGFYSDYSSIKNGDVSTAENGPHDSDNLWTSMYLAGELFRWLVTHDEDARQNCLESLDAMERLHTLSGIAGLFGRCIERHGVVTFNEEYPAAGGKPEIRNGIGEAPPAAIKQ